MSWLALLKSKEKRVALPTKTTESVFVVSVGGGSACNEKFGCDFGGASGWLPLLDWCDSTLRKAMNDVEVDRFIARVARFTDLEIDLDGSGLIAQKLLERDRSGDDRFLCLECAHLRRGSRCLNWRRAGVALRATDANLPLEFTKLLQRCDGFIQFIKSEHQYGTGKARR